jgi:hypothetical protein
MFRGKRIILWVVVVLLCLSCCFVLPCTKEGIRDDEPWGRSWSCLRQIGLALRFYFEENKKLPPAVVYSKNGRPLYSWRVLLLPYLEEVRLYQRFNLEEPWDSPHNKKLLKETPSCYLPVFGTDDFPGMTHYQVFIGPGTAFERPDLTRKDFTDDLSATILVVEASEPVPWSKPVDLAYDPNKPLPRLGGIYGKPFHFLCYEIARTPGFGACFADGSARFIRSDTDAKTIRALITRNGGEEVDPSDLD